MAGRALDAASRLLLTGDLNRPESVIIRLLRLSGLTGLSRLDVGLLLTQLAHQHGTGHALAAEPTEFLVIGLLLGALRAEDHGNRSKRAARHL
jgi:hypothetical protein